MARAPDFLVGRTTSQRQPAQRLLHAAAWTALTATGRRRYDLLVISALAAADATPFLIGASSFDGEAFLPVDLPVLKPSLGGRLLAAVATRMPQAPDGSALLGQTLRLLAWQGARQGILAGRR